MPLLGLDLTTWHFLVAHLDACDLFRLFLTGTSQWALIKPLVRDIRLEWPLPDFLPLTSLIQSIPWISESPKSLRIWKTPSSFYPGVLEPWVDWTSLSGLENIELCFHGLAVESRNGVTPHSVAELFPGLVSLTLRDPRSLGRLHLPRTLTHLELDCPTAETTVAIPFDMPPLLRVLISRSTLCYGTHLDDPSLSWRHLPLETVRLSLSSLPDIEFDFLPPTIISLDIFLSKRFEVVPPPVEPKSWRSIFPKLQVLRVQAPSLLHLDPGHEYTSRLPLTLTELVVLGNSSFSQWNMPLSAQLVSLGLPALGFNIAEIGERLKRLELPKAWWAPLRELLAKSCPNLSYASGTNHEVLQPSSWGKYTVWKDYPLLEDLTLRIAELADFFPLPSSLTNLSCQTNHTGYTRRLDPRRLKRTPPTPFPALEALSDSSWPLTLTRLQLELDFGDKGSPMTLDLSILPSTLNDLSLSTPLMCSELCSVTGQLDHMRNLNHLYLAILADSINQKSVINSLSQLPPQLSSLDYYSPILINHSVLMEKADGRHGLGALKKLVLSPFSIQSFHPCPLRYLMDLPPTLTQLEFVVFNADIIGVEFVQSLPRTLETLKIFNLSQESWENGSAASMRYLPRTLRHLALHLGMQITDSILPPDVMDHLPMTLDELIMDGMEYSSEFFRLRSKWRVQKSIAYCLRRNLPIPQELADKADLQISLLEDDAVVEYEANLMEEEAPADDLLPPRERNAKRPHPT